MIIHTIYPSENISNLTVVWVYIPKIRDSSQTLPPPVQTVLLSLSEMRFVEMVLEMVLRWHLLQVKQSSSSFFGLIIFHTPPTSWKMWGPLWYWIQEVAYSLPSCHFVHCTILYLILYCDSCFLSLNLVRRTSTLYGGLQAEEKFWL